MSFLSDFTYHLVEAVQHKNIKTDDFYIKMRLSYEHAGSKILAKIKTYTLTRAGLFLTLCYEIPCTGKFFSEVLILAPTNPQYDKIMFIELQVKYMKITSSSKSAHA